MKRTNNIKDNNLKLAYLIGHPIAHSKSPIFQNAAFKHLNINSEYIALDIEKNDFDKKINDIKMQDILGINITLPYKQDILKYTDELSPDADIIGSVNTIEIKDNKWIGHNTDWYGVHKTLEINKISNKAKTLIIGAGGAAPGTIFGLQSFGLNDIDICNRTRLKAEKLLKKFNINIIDFEDINILVNNYQLVVNCTTLEFNNILTNLNKETTYFDLKYYVKDLEGFNYINGKDMLLYQGAKSFSIWTKMEAPIQIMKDALSK